MMTCSFNFFLSVIENIVLESLIIVIVKSLTASINICSGGFDET